MSDNNLVVCIGEILIDFFCTDIEVDLKNGTNYVKQAGGAPANVSAAIAKLGGKAAFVGTVGNDPFGTYLIETMNHLHVDTTMILKDDKTKTTLAFVSLKANGERDFVFCRGADEQLKLGVLETGKLMAAKILHFGSATAFLGGNLTETYLLLMNLAKERGIFISFDPNFRKDLWEGREQEFIELTKVAVSKANFTKVSKEELILITGKENLGEGAKYLHQLGSKIVAVTLGKEGTFLSSSSGQKIVPSIPIKSIDSTGAGDGFVGATLYQLSKEEDPFSIIKNFKRQEEIIRFSNKAGAIVCTKIGAITALPTLEEVIFEKK